MNLHEIFTKAKQRLHQVQEHVARTILIWLEKEPSQDRILSTSTPGEAYGSYMRHRPQRNRRCAETKKVIHNHTA